MEQWNKLGIEDLARLFGAPPEDLARHCEKEIKALDSSYRVIDGKERDALLLRIMKTIDSPDLAIAGETRKPDWETGWSENLEAYIESNYDPSMLVPRYYRKRAPVRLFGQYVMPKSDNFVFHLTNIFRLWMFKTHFADKRHIFEFGCGSGQHIACLAHLFPQAVLTGLDWATASQDILALLAEKTGSDVHGLNFDFFNPDLTMDIPEDSAVFTFGALEQCGPRHDAFLDMLLQKSLGICINIEGLHELYDQDSFTDYLAYKYHKRRGYLDGYLSSLRRHEEQGVLKILAVYHQQFGNIFDDPHSYVIWKPTR